MRWCFHGKRALECTGFLARRAHLECAELAWHTLEEMLEAHNSGSAAAGASTTEDGTESKRAEDGE